MYYLLMAGLTAVVKPSLTLVQGEKIHHGFQVDYPVNFLYYDHQLRGKSKIYLTPRLLQSSEDNAPSRTTPCTYSPSNESILMADRNARQAQSLLSVLNSLGTWSAIPTKT